MKAAVFVFKTITAFFFPEFGPMGQVRGSLRHSSCGQRARDQAGVQEE